MLLPELIADAGGASRVMPVDIRGLTADSRDVRAGYLFAAFPGSKQDGRAFIADAIRRGAVAILAPEGTVIDDPAVALVTDANPRRLFARLAASFYGRQMDVIAAVTGTNGKTSTVNFCRHIWQTMDRAAASLGTVGIIAPGLYRPGLLTTPDPVTLHAEIAELEASGVTHLALEASSQGLDQYRLDGVHVTAAGFTNLTRDHLDYHGSMDEYLAAKIRLFTDVLSSGGIAVLNREMDCFDAVEAACTVRGIRVVDFGFNARDIRLVQHKPLPNGQFIELMVFGERYELELPLVGAFQASNALCALGLVMAEDIDNRFMHMQAVHALERLQSVRGRLELAVHRDDGAAVYVDYAHTPDGLEAMLKALRPHTRGELHVVFGCGGDRDRGKRPLMGEIAARLADAVIVTDDNPRSEDAAAIRTEVMAGCAGISGARVLEIAGRRDAIRASMRDLAPGDVLVIAGKGHEQGQIIGQNVLPFDDISEARAASEEIE